MLILSTCSIRNTFSIVFLPTGIAAITGTCAFGREFFAAAPPLGIWQFDATLQLNGGGRMPAPYELGDGQLSWERRYGSFEQLSLQVTRYFRRWSIYVGGENLTNFKQKNPIVDAANPWGDNFDSTMIWGPMHGAKAYIGIRFNLARNSE